MSMRSENVPESPSSALQAMYFCAAVWSCTVCHLMPVGNAAPPRPRKSGVGHRAHDVLRRHRQAPAQARVAAVRDVVIDVARIDDAEARGGESLLASQPGMVFDVAEPQRVRSHHPAIPRRAVRPTDLARRRPAPDRRRRGPPESPTSISGSSQYRPREPVRTMRTGSSRRWHSRASSRGDGVRAQRNRAGIAGHEHRDGARALMRARPSRRRSPRALRGRTRPADLAIDHRRRRAGAVAEAVHGFERDRAIGARLAEIEPAGAASRIPRARRRSSPGRPRRGTAGRCAPGRPFAKVMIETDDAVHFGARQVQRLGDQRHGIGAARSRARSAPRAGSRAAARARPSSAGDGRCRRTLDGGALDRHDSLRIGRTRAAWQ